MLLLISPQNLADVSATVELKILKKMLNKVKMCCF